jgi:hypothetical protein
MVLSYLPALRTLQDNLMTDVIQVWRDGALVYDQLPARVTSSRLFTEPADPHDANLRSTSEWGFTLHYQIVIHVADELRFGPAFSQNAIVGEVLADDTWKTAVRVWATRPKTATPFVEIELFRFDDIAQDWLSVGVQALQVVFDRVAPLETPLRYSPAGRTSYQGGTLIGPMSFDVQVDDRFTLNTYGCIVDSVLPTQPQHIEAHFLMDMSGAR